jgi:uncharacterized protein YoxC
MPDVLMLTGVICLIIITIYLVKTLKSLQVFLNRTTDFVEEGTKVVEDVQQKTRAVDDFIVGLSSGSGVVTKIFKGAKKE